MNFELSKSKSHTSTKKPMITKCNLGSPGEVYSPLLGIHADYLGDYNCQFDKDMCTFFNYDAAHGGIYCKMALL